MPTTTQMDARDLTSLLSRLLGRKVTANPARRPLNPDTDLVMVATYTNDQQKTAGLFVCDLVAGASLGAALSMLPPVRVTESVQDGQLDDFMQENLHEVCNVLVRWFNHTSPSPLALTGLQSVAPGQPRILKQMDQFQSRLDLVLAVSGYGEGRFSLMT